MRRPCTDRVPSAQLLRTSSSASTAADAPDAGAAALPGSLAAKLRAGGPGTSACHTLSSHPLFQRKSASAAAGQGAADSPGAGSPQGSGSPASGGSPRGNGGGGDWRFAEPVGPATGQALLHIHRGSRKEGGAAEPGSPVAPVTP